MWFAGVAEKNILGNVHAGESGVHCGWWSLEQCCDGINENWVWYGLAVSIGFGCIVAVRWFPELL